MHSSTTHIKQRMDNYLLRNPVVGESARCQGFPWMTFKALATSSCFSNEEGAPVCKYVLVPKEISKCLCSIIKIALWWLI